MDELLEPEIKYRAPFLLRISPRFVVNIYYFLRRYSFPGRCHWCGRFVILRKWDVPARSTWDCKLCSHCYDDNRIEWQAAWDEYYSGRL